MTEAERDTRDRVMRMEVKVENIDKRLEEMEEKMDARMAKIEKGNAQILDILTQAKGIQWLFRVAWPGVVWGAAIVVSYWTSVKGFFAKIGG